MAAEGFRDRFGGLFRRRDDDRAPDHREPEDRAPGDPALASAAAETEDERTARSLDVLRGAIRSSGRHLPTVLSSRLRHLDDELRAVLATVLVRGASTEQHYLLDAMITDYIADPFRTYLGLPDADRTDTSDATRVFAEQLGVLEETVHDMHNQIRIGAIAELSAHGRFLADKFAGPDTALTLGSGPAQRASGPERGESLR